MNPRNRQPDPSPVDPQGGAKPDGGIDPDSQGQSMSRRQNRTDRFTDNVETESDDVEGRSGRSVVHPEIEHGNDPDDETAERRSR